MNRMEIDEACAILGCEQTDLLINYLGMSLTIIKPDRSAFMPLVEKLERKLQGWKGKLIISPEVDYN